MDLHEMNANIYFVSCKMFVINVSKAAYNTHHVDLVLYHSCCHYNELRKSVGDLCSHIQRME